MPKVVDIEQRRLEITDAAARVIARAGVESTTMREVAAEAGWTTGVITHYFASKHELLLATFLASIAHRRSLRLEPDEASSVRLRATLKGALPLDEDRRRHWLVTLACCVHAGADDALADAQRDAYREFRDYVAELVRATDDSPATDAQVEAERLIAGVDGVAIQALFDPETWTPQKQTAALDELLAPSPR